MDRPIIYTYEGLRSKDFLLGARGSMVGLAKLAEAVFGSSTLVDGLACAPGAGLTVSIAAGSIYAQAVVDATTYGTVAADSHVVLKQGLLADPATLACPAPGTAGRSINYLVQVQFQETDTNNEALPFYDSANPTVPIFTNGNTLRQDVCAVSIKAGTSAVTGTQTTPAPDAGWTGLWVVTIDNGQSTVLSADIVAYTAAPFISWRLRDLGMLLTAQTDTGAANALAITPAPALAAYAAGMTITVIAANANTGAATLNISALGAKAIVQPGGAALAPRQITAGAVLELAYDGTSFVLANAPKLLDGSAYAAAGGTANALTATITAPFSAYTAGQRVAVKATADNTGAATINLNSLGAKSIVRAGGVALVKGDIVTGSVLDLVYDGANFILANPARALDGNAYAVASGTANALTVTTSGPLPAYAAGVALDVLATAANTAATTINVNTLGVKAIVNYDGSDLLAGEIAVGMVLRLVYNGTAFVYQNAPFGPTPPLGANDKRMATMAALQSAITNSLTCRYLDATTTTPLTAGSFYQVDCSAGAISAPLPAAPTRGDTFTFADVAKVWGTNPLTLTRNGLTIRGLAEDLLCNKTNLQFSMWWTGITWDFF